MTMCSYCEEVDFETADPRDRDLLLNKKFICQNVCINGNEMIVIEPHLGYYVIKDRTKINNCPMCGS